MMTQDQNDRDVLVGFCVDVAQPSDKNGKQEIYTNFRRLFEENIKYSKVKDMVHQMLQERKEVNDLEADQHNQSQPTPDIEFIRAKVKRENIKFKRNENLPAVEDSSEPVEPLDIVSERYQCTRCGRWETLLPGFNLARTVTFLTRDTDGTEFLLFSSASSNLQIEMQKHYKVLTFKSSSRNMIKVEGSIEKPESVYHVESLDAVEKYLFSRSPPSPDSANIVIEAERLQSIFKEYEDKYDFNVIIINKLNSATPKIVCYVELAKDSTVDEEKCVARKRQHHNPDEIIDGRPKWCGITVSRPGGKEETLDFDRLNPHRSFVAEFEDEFDNTDWRYNNTLLKMVADLNCETTVTLGDSKINPADEKKYLDEYLVWQEYKREISQNSPKVRLKKMKADKTVKIRENKIISKILRKDFLYS